MWLLASRLTTVVEEGKPAHVKPVRPLSCSSSVTVFARVFQRCCVAEDWLRDWSCAKLDGRTMGLCKMDVTGPPVKGSSRKYSDRGQPPSLSENEPENVPGDCPLELDESRSRPGRPAQRCGDRKVTGNDRNLCRLAVRCA